MTPSRMKAHQNQRKHMVCGPSRPWHHMKLQTLLIAHPGMRKPVFEGKICPLLLRIQHCPQSYNLIMNGISIFVTNKTCSWLHTVECKVRFLLSRSSALSPNAPSLRRTRPMRRSLKTSQKMTSRVQRMKPRRTSQL